MPETIINNTIVDILYKLVNEQSLLPQEQALLDDWLAGSEHKKALLAELMNEGQLFEEVKKRYAFNTTDEWLKMVEKLRADSTIAAVPPVADLSDEAQSSQPVVHRIHFLKTSWFRYAAAVVLVAGGVGVWWELSRSARNEGSVVSTVSRSEDIEPGTNKAILTIGNKRPIDLSSAKTGIAVGSVITYTDGEKIANAGELLMLATPRGGQYQAVLPDGSKVWLNAASSIRFPSKFSGATREIEVKGEVYVEVAQNSKQPFYVHTHKTTIQVLGTSFNINAYEDEELEKTTLIEGSVRVLVNPAGSSQRSTLLKPGQQSIYSDNSPLSAHPADIEQALAWKNGIFNFNNVDIKGMMRQLSRWYNIDVQYEGSIPQRIFEGKMQRDIPLSSALKILELNKINFRVEGKKIIVMP